MNSLLCLYAATWMLISSPRVLEFYNFSCIFLNSALNLNLSLDWYNTWCKIFHILFFVISGDDMVSQGRCTLYLIGVILVVIPVSTQSADHGKFASSQRLNKKKKSKGLLQTMSFYTKCKGSESNCSHMLALLLIVHTPAVYGSQHCLWAITPTTLLKITRRAYYNSPAKFKRQYMSGLLDPWLWNSNGSSSQIFMNFVFLCLKPDGVIDNEKGKTNFHGYFKGGEQVQFLDHF